MSDVCDRIWEIDALREGRLGTKDAEAFERHARTCDACSQMRAGDQRLRDLAACLEIPAPADLDLPRLRARVLREVELQNPRPRAWYFKAAIGMAIALLASSIIGVRHRRASRGAPRHERR